MSDPLCDVANFFFVFGIRSSCTKKRQKIQQKLFPQDIVYGLDKHHKI